MGQLVYNSKNADTKIILSRGYKMYSFLEWDSAEFIYRFSHTTCQNTSDTLPSSAANLGAQGTTATPGATT